MDYVKIEYVMLQDLFSQLPSKGLPHNTRIYAKIVDSLCQERSLEEVKRLLVEMENCGYEPGRLTYHVIIRSLLKQSVSILSRFCNWFGVN